jgi:xanthine dehydrogenase molybdenum-binding subunit
MHGLGFTWNHEWEDSAGSGEIAMRIERNDGTLSILGMRCDNGVNAETAYCQIAADELGMKLEDVFYRPHVDPGFFTMTPDSSTNMSVNGFAVRHCARILKEKILKAATSPRAVTQRGSYPPLFAGMKPEDLDMMNSVIYVKKDPSRKVTLAEFVGPSGDEGPLAFYELYGTERTPFSEPLFAHSYHVQVGAYRGGVRPRLIRQAHFMEVEVDTETGEIKVIKVVNVNDVGKAINPMACEGQMYGGTYMGVGRALWEEVIHDPVTGVMLNGNLLDYKITTIGDCGPIDTIVVETGLGFGPYGLTGIGEDVATMIPALMGPAVFNAIGRWIDEYPITPEKILKALGKL